MSEHVEAIGSQRRALNPFAYTKSGFVKRLEDGCELPEKREDRNRIIQFVLAHHAPGRLRAFSMPSISWRFETEIIHRYPGRAEFICVERESAVVARSAYALPLGRVEQITIPCGLGEFHAKKGNGFTFIEADLRSFFLDKRERGRNHSQRKDWNQSLHRWTCGWIDMECSLSAEYLSIARRVWSRLDARRVVVPFAFTYQVGREIGVLARLVRAGAQRCRLLLAALNRNAGAHAGPWKAEIVEVNRRSGSGCTMETVLVLFTNTPATPLPPSPGGEKALK